MASRIVIGGKTWWQNPAFYQHTRERRLAKASLPRDREGNVVNTDPIPLTSPVSPYREGEPYLDEDDRVIYRRVRKLDPRDGWATTEFWQERWHVYSHRAICQLVELGLLDAAVQENSQVKFYRCRDEARVLKSSVIKGSQDRREARLAKKRMVAKTRK